MLSLLPLVMGVLVIIGWITKSVELIQILPSFVPMQFNTALGFIFLSLASIIYTHLDEKYNILATVFSGFVTLLGLATLFEYGLNVDLGIDELFIEHYVTTLTSNPGRMAPNTAFCFTIGGMVFLFRSRGILNSLFSGAAGVLLMTLGMVSLTGYTIGIEGLYGWGALTNMAIHTAAGFMLIGVGVIVTNWGSDEGKRLILQHPKYFAVSIAFAILVFVINLWQSLIAAGVDSQISSIVFIFGLSLSLALYLSLKFAFSTYRAESIRANIMSSMSHDLRTPLNAIIGFSEIMSSQTYGPQNNKRYLEYSEDILYSGKYLLSLVNDLLDVSEIEAGAKSLNKSMVCLETLITNCYSQLHLLAENKTIKWAVTIGNNIKKVNVDEQAITQILINIVSNAIKFTPENGEISVSLDTDLKYHIIEVRDTGIGIEPEILDSITEKFIRNHTDPHHSNIEGSGLGLFITKSLLDLHKGHLQIDSQVGVGTIVKCYLPIGVK